MENDDDCATCTVTHRILAGHILHAMNLGYTEVTATHLRIFERDGAPDVWEAEVVCESLGVSYMFRDTCPLEAALAVANEIVEVLEAQRERAGAMVLH